MRRFARMRGMLAVANMSLAKVNAFRDFGKNSALSDKYKIHQIMKSDKPDSDSMMEWLPDSLRPNCYGHIETAKEIFRPLNIYDGNSKVCGLFVP